MSWREGMALAYARGVEHGKIGYEEPYSANGFDACYWEGFGHGAKKCRCPERLAGKRWGQRCINCGNRRHAEDA